MREHGSPTRSAARAVVPGLLSCAVLLACGAGSERNGPRPVASAPGEGLCAGVGDAAPLTPLTTFVGRAGVYRLVLADSTTGGADPGRAAGTLTLRATPSDLREVTTAGGRPVAGVITPLYGWTDVDPRLVGATAPGDVASRDPARPGVLVVEDRRRDEAPPAVVLRLGDHANDRSRTTFDQAFMALRVEWVAPGGSFAGGWSSGGRGGRAGVRGTFCATPTPP